jgi:hypothetical protein
MNSSAARLVMLLLLFAATAKAQTWKEMPVNGQLFSPPTWPSERGYTRLVYDPVNQQHLYMSAENLCNVYTNALWGYNAAKNTFTILTWSGSFPNHRICNTPAAPDTATYPGDRHPYHTQIYDILRSRLVIYSGAEALENCAGTGHGICNFPDTYHYFSSLGVVTTPGLGWMQDCGLNANLPACAPGTRQEGAMTYDSVQDLIVLYGALQHGTGTSDTWVYAGGPNTWSKVTTQCSGANCVANACGKGCNSLGQRAGHSMVYDSLNRKVVLFGGYVVGAGIENDTWIYDTPSGTWTESKSARPPAVKYPAMAFDTKRGIIWLHTGLGNPAGDDWTYNVATDTWTHMTSITGGPVPKSQDKGYIAQNTLTMDYDPVLDSLIATADDATDITKMWQISLVNIP